MNGRAKGSVAEREVARLLEDWWQTFEACKFVRTPMSGGWGGPQVRSEFRASGDLMTTAPSFPFVVEVKRREIWSFERLIEGKPSPVWGWWKQAQAQAEELQLEPMLWLRKNRRPWTIMLSASFWRRVQARKIFEAQAARRQRWTPPRPDPLLMALATWDETDLIHHDLGAHPMLFQMTTILGNSPRTFVGVP